MGGSKNSSESRPLNARERGDAYQAGIRNMAQTLPDFFKLQRVQTGVNRTPIYSNEGGGGGGYLGDDMIWHPSGGNRTITGYNETPIYSDSLTLDTSKLAYNAPEYESLNNGDYNALEQNIVQSRTAPLAEAWRKAQESINQDASNRGLWASGVPIKNEQDYYAREFLPAYQQAGADAAIQRYGMQQQDLQNKNAFTADQTGKEYEARTRWLDYLQGLYNNTGGVISSSSGGGWSL